MELKHGLSHPSHFTLGCKYYNECDLLITLSTKGVDPHCPSSDPDHEFCKQDCRLKTNPLTSSTHSCSFIFSMDVVFLLWIN